MATPLRTAFVLVAVLAVTLALAPVQILAMRFNRPLARRIPVLWHRAALALVGVRVHIKGEIPARRPLLIVSNHISWSDILVLGSIMELCFIAKSDVTGWPGVSWLARMQRTVFIDRSRRQAAGDQNRTIAARLLDGDAMVLFPEGTTGDGKKLLPFKSALFGSVHAALLSAHIGHVTVQPVAIAYTRLHGLPLGRYHQARAAWPGSIRLAPHLMSFVADGAWDVDVVLCKPVDFARDTSRKEIAAGTRASIHQAFAQAMRMR
jgi:1-acyl-sn-glycerol-3-phosphate acyltransferase